MAAEPSVEPSFRDAVAALVGHEVCIEVESPREAGAAEHHPGTVGAVTTRSLWLDGRGFLLEDVYRVQLTNPDFKKRADR